jgi:hypothetical protein
VDDTITTTCYLCEEFLKATGHRDDPQVLLSPAEVMTIALAAAAFFGGNIEASRSLLDEYGYIEKAISKSRFNRRLHAIDSSLWHVLFDLLAPRSSSNAIPSKPTWWIPCRWLLATNRPHPPLQALSSTRARRGFPRLHCSKRRYFYGLRVQLVTTRAGEPVEFCLAAASEADISLFKDLSGRNAQKVSHATPED